MTPLHLIAAALILLTLFVAIEHRTGRTRGAPVPSRPAPVPKRQMRRDVPHALYVYPHRVPGWFVYPGISNDPEDRHRRRMADFRRGVPEVAWVADSTGEMQIVRWYPSWAEARAAERALIRRLALEGHPLANYQDNPLRKGVRRAA